MKIVFIGRSNYNNVYRRILIRVFVSRPFEKFSLSDIGVVNICIYIYIQSDRFISPSRGVYRPYGHYGIYLHHIRYENETKVKSRRTKYKRYK